MHNGVKSLTLCLDRDDYDKAWMDRQLASIDEYSETQLESILDNQLVALYELFSCFISRALISHTTRPLNILDVGCGMRPDLPPYIPHLVDSVHYYGLDPLKYGLERSYPFFCGDFTELARVTGLESGFDLFICGTSLDHIADMDGMIKDMRLLAAPGARLVSWSGVHDPEIAGQHNGSLVFSNILTGNPIVGAAKYFGYGIMRLPRLLHRASRARHYLSSGIPLDSLHERYFTQSSLDNLMSRFGSIEYSVSVPGSNAMFHHVLIEND